MQWVVDIVGAGFGQATQIEDILYDHRSPFQHIQVATSARYGRMLILDDAVQTTERDEHIYHEMLVHLPMATHRNPHRALIIGGGDGGALEEVLKHPVQTVTMVEIDREVVEVSRTYLPSIAGAAFEDRRGRLLIADGIAFVRDGEEQFDVILVDSTDPTGPGLALFSEEFYRSCARRLAPAGLLAVQSGSPLFQRELMASVAHHLAAIFPVVVPYWAAVPSYPGTLWSFTLASAEPHPGRFRHLAIPGLRYYSPTIHQTALALPPLP